jgi:mRNA interferase MazF
MENHSMTKDKIVLVPFPFDDLSAKKVRPAVCLTDPIGQHRHVILAFITSNTNQEFLETDVILDSNDKNFNVTGLHVSSALRLHRLMTVTTSLICRELGELSPEMKKQVVEKLRKLFDLN